jgi:hypothetical protein
LLIQKDEELEDEEKSRAQRVRSLIFIPFSEAFWRPISPPIEGEKLLV